MSSRPVAVITGASRGIGAAIALELSPTYQLVLLGRDEDALRSVAQKCEYAQYHCLDITHPQQLAELAGTLQRVDVLVNNAGVAHFSPVVDTTWENWQSSFTVNVFAVAQLTALLLPQLRSSHGDIIMINSGAGKFSGPGMAVYAGTKHALHALTVALREEERGKVRVTAIHPGRVDTDMQRALQAGKAYDKSEHVSVQSIAKAVHFALEATDECTVEEINVRPVVKQVHG
ncbi:short chain dehydrogenase [Boudabousia marimammalium]|uniref:Short chain dehydrogenase n=2 Tax=Boudabousia marimammalium TaxID=156892 RepID=A0A1Q5PRB1_9ACTO|nr:short chain dehydrogenase [Boudabousia marimammalium]